MTTIATIIGEPDDPVVEEVRSIFSAECGRMEQAEMQRRKPTIIERRAMEWRAAKRIVAAVSAALALSACASSPEHMRITAADIEAMQVNGRCIVGDCRRLMEPPATTAPGRQLSAAEANALVPW